MSDDEEVKAMIMEAFKAADDNGDGFISKEELANAFANMDFDSEEFDALYEGADTNDDGKISYEEFVEWVFSVNEDKGEVLEFAEDMACANEEEGSEDESWWGGESEEEGSDWEEWEEEEDWEDCGDCDEELMVECADDEVPPDEGEHFEDPDFPANMESLGKTEGDTASGIVAEATGEWTRLASTLEEPSLYKDIQSRDVVQGTLGNCWFLAACASVANYPAWIQQMFEKVPEIRSDGMYQVRMYHPGKKTFTYITVSDEVPSDESTPIFVSPTQTGEIWPCLVEKAFAKFSGSYASTEAGFPVWGMTYLCGGVGECWERKEEGNWARSLTVWNGGEDAAIEGSRGDAEQFEDCEEGEEKTQKQLWAALLAYALKHFPMCCSIGSEQEDMKGLISGHAYSLLTVRSIKTGTGNVLKLCKVRNPHGETEWTGKWSDASEMWKSHPNIAKELRFKVKDDGAFWMSFHDFCAFFDMLSINKRAMPLEGAHADILAAHAAASAPAEEVAPEE